MANEYLKRTPTSTGNRKVFTLSGWYKINLSSWSSNDYTTIFNTNANNQESALRLRTGTGLGDNIQFFHYNGSGPAYLFDARTSLKFRDCGGWVNIIVSVDTTASTSTDRIKIYVNGVLQTSYETYSAASINYETNFNSTITHYFGANQGQYNPAEVQLSDIFFVDGQALTPDVFGYYKKGDGYISVGSTQSTDFKKGQWVPKAPKVIKSVINARGGFGVNGFYLPMNEGTNFGADLHCTPNSIIKLKGEDEPQPYYGAPTTTDAYVSQLRTDPYKDYLVFAMPGISTATGANLVTNGNFESDISGWTASGVQFTHTYNSVGGNTSGKLMYFATGTNTTRSIYQNVTTETGKRYTLTFDASSDTASANTVKIDGTDVVTVTDNNNSAFVHHNVSFTAASTSTEIKIESTVSNRSYFDNIVVKQEDAPRDYSADIKGSGTNKTLTVLGNAGVGYEIPSYYGSAVSLNDNASEGLLLGWGEGDPDYDFGTGDFTMEAWVYPSVQDAGYWSVLRSRYYSGADGSGLALYGYQDGFRMWERTSSSSGATNIHGGDVGSAPAGQWTHIALVRHNGRILSFCNGVCVGNDENSVYYENNGFEIGQTYPWQGYIQDVRIYKGVAKYENGFDIVKPYTPVGIESWRAVPDTTANNFATMNPLIEARPSSGTNSPSNSTIVTFADGNLNLSNSASSGQAQRMVSFATIGITTGKWYYEEIPSSNSRVGLSKGFQQLDYAGGQLGGGSGLEATVMYTGNGTVSFANTAYYSTATTLSPPAFNNTNIIGVSIDASLGENNLTVEFYKDGVGVSTLTGVGATSPVREWFPTKTMSSSGSADQRYFNFGQNPTFSGNTSAGTYTDSNGKGLFKYEPPTGFLALCEDNLPTPAIADPGEHFKTVLYTGDNRNSRGIVGVGFQPDLVWIKCRNAAQGHVLFDSVRGPRYLLPSSTTAEDGAGSFNWASNGAMSMSSDGFTVALGSNGSINTNNNTYVAWCWKAGGAAVSNTDGTITSQVSVNQTAGFSIATWTGTGTGSQTIGHGLGKAPDFYIWKSRDNAREWHIAHKGLTAYNYTLYFTNAGEFNNDKIYQAPSSTLIYPENSNTINGSGEDYVGYFWTEIEGFSKFGSYEGNLNADGPFVYCGFKPAVVIIKCADGAASWVIQDSSRTSTNPSTLALIPDSTGAELDASTLSVDFLSNGFKIRNINGSYNNNGTTYIFAAWAETPFTTANAK